MPDPEQRRVRGPATDNRPQRAVVLRQRDEDHTGGRDHNGCDRKNRDPVAEQDEAEHRDLQQLGLGIGDPEREIALLHNAQEQRGGRDLAQRGD